MPLFLGGLLGIAAALASGGSLQNLSRLRLRWPLVVVAALLIKEVGVFTPLAASAAAPYLYSASLIALLAWILWHARSLPGLWLLAAGVGLNLLVVLSNGGHMPVDPAAVDRGPHALATAGTLGQYTLAGDGTRLAVLGDRLTVPPPWDFLLPSAYSLGDMVAGAGMALTLFLACRSQPRTVS